ncbi:MAG TPA: hypothetical protein VKR82_14245 [Candidatus Acidoferrales bacterium]|nr:hypothetical protein [Candidatus Acidoferrales bacterium]
MLQPRREFLINAVSSLAFPTAMASPAAASAIRTLLAGQVATGMDAEIDAKASKFWAEFLSHDGQPALSAGAQTRGGGNSSDAQPVFLHYGPDGFKNAAELDVAKLVPQGDVLVGINTSTVKVATEDLKTFQRLQNAQIRVDVAQKTPILPILEAMAYTVVGGMKAIQNAAANAKNQPVVQSISLTSDADWQKMQNIPLPAGGGRWALNLEAQKKDSLFSKIVQIAVKEGGMFAPMFGFPGIAMSALNSFNTIYGLLHSAPVSVIAGNPVPIYATQEAVQNTESPGSVTGIRLQSGTYVLMPARQAPSMSQLKDFTVTQGRVVPPNTDLAQLDAAASDVLKDTTYVTFDVQVTPTTFVTGPGKK